MSAEWNEIEKLRKEAHDAIANSDKRDGNVSQTIDDNPRIRELLETLSTAGDLDAAVQRSLNAISRLYYEGTILRCEAFARAMQSIAQHVARKYPGSFNASAYLSLAWGYLISNGYQDFFPDAANTLLSHRRSHGYDLVAPEGHWSNEHTPGEGAVGSGWMPPLEEDKKNPLVVPTTAGMVTVEHQARSGKQDHFITNAVANYYANSTAITSIAGTAAWLKLQSAEDSKTDAKMNSLGRDFGAFLRGGFIPPDPGLSPDRIADWIRENLCTETFKATLYWQSRDQVNYPDNERASYHYYDFKLVSYGQPKREEVKWQAWVRVAGGHSHTAWSGLREIELRLAKCQSREDVIKEAQAAMEAVGMEFKTPPGR